MRRRDRPDSWSFECGTAHRLEEPAPDRYPTAVARRGTHAAETMMTMTQSAVLAGATLLCGVAAVWFFRRGIAWLRALLGLHRQVVRLDALEAAVADLRRRTGVRPADLRIVGGAVWGRIGSDEEFHPFCPWCASKDSCTLLVREDERGNETFRCVPCHRHIPSGHLMPPTIR